MFSNDYYPNRYGSRRSIASSMAGPPPVSRSGGPPPLAGPSSPTNPFHNMRDSAGSPWPMPSAPSSPAPAPPPAVQSSRGAPGGPRRIEEPSPLTIPPARVGRVSPVSPPTPAQHQQPQQRQSRASMEQEFTQKHVQLVDQAKVLLAEMKALQILGPIHGAHNNSTATHSDDGTNSSSYLQSDDASSLLSGSNTTTNNTAAYYEQDEAAMSALNAILAGNLGSMASKPPPRPVRVVAREVISKVGPVTSSALLAGSEGEADAIELLMDDYQAVVDWARSSSSSITMSSAASSSSSVLSVQPHTQGQTQTQSRIQRCLNDRQALLEAALPSHLAHLCADAMMHFGHEKLYAPSVRVSTPSVHSEHNGHSGNGNSNGASGGLSVNGSGGREIGPGFQQLYANSQTFRDGTPIDEIPRRRFIRTDDGYAWDMLELASELHHELANSYGIGTRREDERGGSQQTVRIRNPVTRAFFAPADVSRILAHPMGRSLVPSPLVRAQSPSPSPRPPSPLPLPEPVSSFVQTQLQQQDGERDFEDGEYRGYQGSYRPQLFDHRVEPESEVAQAVGEEHDNGNGNDDPEMSWPSPLTLRQPPPPPYSITSEPPEVPTSPPPPIPLPTTTAATPAATTRRDHDTDSHIPEPLGPYSPPSSPPPALGAANSSSSTQHQQNQQLPEPVPRPIPIPRPLPGSYPTWEERERENDERFNPDYARYTRSYELLAASPPRPVSIRSPPSAPTVGPNQGQRTTESNLPLTSTATAISATNPDTDDTINDPSTGGEYRSLYLGNTNPFRSVPPLTTPTSQINSPTNNNNNTTTLYQNYRPNLPSNPPASPPSTSRSPPSQFNNNGMPANGDTGKFSRNSYLSSQYGVATPPPSGPIPVSSLIDATSTSSSTTEHRYQFNAYPFPSLSEPESVVQHDDQRGRGRENREDTSGTAGGEYPLVNPFASSRDNSADGRAEMDAGPFELDDNSPGLTRGNFGRRGNSAERDDDADSREWMGSLASVRR